MIELVSFDEEFGVYMGVNLCGIEACVSQKFLHHPQVYSRLKQMRGKGMAKV